VLKPIRESFGGRLRLMLVGGAPVSESELEFMRLVLSIPIVEGYGLTESCACSFVTDPNDRFTGHVGGPLPGLEAKLINITASDQGDIEGELCLRGTSIASQFYMPEGSKETGALLDREGWLHTGDRVLRSQRNGSFRVTGRLKDLFKLSHGEFISPEKIENCYKCPYIDLMVVYGNPLRSNLVALVVPSESKLRSSLDESHPFRSEIPIDQLCANDQVRLFLLGKLKDHSAKHYLNAYEQVANILLVPALDPEFFTTVGKLKRAKVLETYGEQLEALYRK
jgi:long-chain acyl-CoA synthetase